MSELNECSAMHDRKRSTTELKKERDANDFYSATTENSFSLCQKTSQIRMVINYKLQIYSNQKLIVVVIFFFMKQISKISHFGVEKFQNSILGFSISYVCGFCCGFLVLANSNRETKTSRDERRRKKVVEQATMTTVRLVNRMQSHRRVRMRQENVLDTSGGLLCEF